MIYDGIKLIEGSALENLVISTGTSFPSSPDEGELFVRTDAGNAGLYVYQSATWNKLLKVGDTVEGGGTAAGITDSIQYNASGALAGSQSFRWNDASKTMTMGTAGGSNVTITAMGPAASTVDGTPLTIKAGNGGSAASGGELRLYGGDATGTTAPGGNVVIRGGQGRSGQPGGTVTVQGGFGEDQLAQGDGGQVILSGGYSHQVSGYGDGGAITIRGGLRGINTNAVGGPIIFQTSNTQTQVERFRILSNGAWSVGSAGNNTGSAGQVLTSQGASSPPIWVTPETGVSNDAVTLTTVQTITATKTFSDKILAGSTTSVVDYASNQGRIQVTGAGGGDSRIHAITYSADSVGPALVLMKSRSASIGSGYTATQANDNTGAIVWAATNGSAFVRNASIASFAESTGSAGTGVPGYLAFYTAPASAPNTLPERMRINSLGQVTVGLTSPVTQANASQAGFSVGSTEVGQSRMAVSIFKNDANSAGLTFTKSRSGTAGSHALVQNGDGLGFMPFEGSTGSAYARGAIISVVVDGTPSSTSMPAKISFYTTPQGSLVPVERFTLTSAGAWSVNSSTGTAGQVLVSNGSASSPTWQDIPNPTKLERVTTFDANARGKRVALSAGITIPSATYAAGDAFSFYNTTGSPITITQGASLTLRQDGTPNTGTRTLAAYGTCFVWFNTTNEAIISGSIS